MRLKEICNQANTKINLKIGGPEDKRSMIDSTTIGVKGLVGPMVESDFGLTKFVKAVKSVVPEDVVKSLNLYVNIETITGTNNIDSISKTNEFKDLHGVTIGRVDLVGSMNKDRNYANSKELLDIATILTDLVDNNDINDRAYVKLNDKILEVYNTINNFNNKINRDL